MARRNSAPLAGLDQQKKPPPEPDHAQTCLYLCNLHMQTGNLDKARQMWKDGLKRFPDMRPRIGWQKTQ